MIPHLVLSRSSMIPRSLSDSSYLLYVLYDGGGMFAARGSLSPSVPRMHAWRYLYSLVVSTSYFASPASPTSKSGVSPVTFCDFPLVAHSSCLLSVTVVSTRYSIVLNCFVCVVFLNKKIRKICKRGWLPSVRS
jgi:hypothetical protein